MIYFNPNFISSESFLLEFPSQNRVKKHIKIYKKSKYYITSVIKRPWTLELFKYSLMFLACDSSAVHGRGPS